MPLEITKETRTRAFSVCSDYLNGAWKTIEADNMIIMHISGGLSNHIYYCALPATTTLLGNEPSEVLVRFHGESQIEGALQENVIFTVLSERRLGPRLYGVFPEGRLEQYIPARPLTTEELSNPLISRLIATRMARIHALNVPVSKEPTWFWDCMKRWLTSSIQFLQASFSTAEPSSPRFSMLEKLIHFDYKNEMTYIRRLVTLIQSPVVFAHNDMQEGNILFKKADETSDTEISFIDFEYCSYNYRGFDFTNHFCEWMYCYKLPVNPYFTYDLSAFPTRQQQLNFIRAYLFAYDAACGKRKKSNASMDLVTESKKGSGQDIQSPQSGSDMEESKQEDPPANIHPGEDKLLREVQVFTLASHFFWALWSIVHGHISKIPFGYLEFALVRMQHYYDSKNSLENPSPEN